MGYLHEAKPHKIINFSIEEGCSSQTLVIRKGICNELVRLLEKMGKLDVMNYDQIYSQSFRSRK